MITFNGKRFVKNQRELAATISDKDNPACGFYRTRKNAHGSGILFMDLHKNAKAFVKFSEAEWAFAVTATDTNKGIRYMYALTDESTLFLGLEGVNLSGQQEIFASAKKQIES